MDGEGIAKLVTESKYSEEEKIRWAKIIKDFNALYYKMDIQTWGNTKWRGVPIVKAPTDLWIYQELIHEIKPDLIIETGTCYGGSALYLRDMLNLVNPEGKVISIDVRHEYIDERARVSGIEFYKGSSVSIETMVYLKAHISVRGCKQVMVILDSDHSEEHVSKELDLYAPLVTVGSILIVEDTSNDPGPIAAVQSWELRQRGFKKNVMTEKYMLTFNRDGYWERE